LVSAFLLAISPAHIWYSQEVRMYSLLVLLCTLSFYLAWHWAQGKGTPWLAGHVLASTAALYTHYCAAFVLIAGNIAFPLLFVLRKEYRKLAFWMGAQACVALAFLPWVPTWRSQVDLDTPWIPRPTWAAIRQSLVYLGFGADWEGSTWDMLRLALVIGGLLATLAYAAWKSLAQSPSARRFFFPAAYLLGPGLLLVGVSLQRSVYQDKQLLIILPAMLIVAGWGISQGGRRPAAASFLLVVALTLAPLYESYFVKIKPQWREMSQHIVSNWQAGDVIYYNAGSASVSTVFYLDDSFPQAGFPMLWEVERGPREGKPATAEGIDKQLGELASSYKRVWLVNYYPAYWDPSGFIQAWLEAHADLQPTPSFYGMNLELYVLK
jgi:mannosyltransferase